MELDFYGAKQQKKLFLRNECGNVVIVFCEMVADHKMSPPRTRPKRKHYHYLVKGRRRGLWSGLLVVEVHSHRSTT